MTTLNGLPAHALLVHFIVVLAPLTAVLAIACAVWPAARQRLVWLVLALSVVTTVLTPLTTDAGEWLEKRQGPSAVLDTHTELGDTMIYFSAPLLVAALLLAFVHIRDRRGQTMKPLAQWSIVVIVIVASIATAVQVYRIGDSGATATWGGQRSAE